MPESNDSPDPHPNEVPIPIRGTALVSEGTVPPRQGSPFRGDPTGGGAASWKPELLPFDIGPAKTTALGAVGASAIILLFSLAATWNFPAGAVVVTSLGAVLALFGMSSPRFKTAIACLVSHLAMFAFSFQALTSS